MENRRISKGKIFAIQKAERGYQLQTGTLPPLGLNGHEWVYVFIPA